MMSNVDNVPALVQRAAGLNQAGISAMLCCTPNVALKAFKQSLALLQTAIGLEEEGDDHDMLLKNTSDDTTTSAHHLWCSEELKGLEDPFFLYNRTLMFNPNNHKSVTTATSAVLFNMALVFHQQGQMMGNLRHLQKALSLYSCSLEISPPPSDIATMSSQSLTVLHGLVVATLNNMAVIYHKLGCYDKSQDTKDRALPILEQLCIHNEEQKQHQQQQPGKLSPFQDTDIAEFYLNFVTLTPPTMAASA